MFVFSKQAERVRTNNTDGSTVQKDFSFLEDLRISTGARSRARRNQRVVVLVVGVMDHGTMTGIDFQVELNSWSGSRTDVLLCSRVKSLGTSKLPLCMLVHSFIFHVVFFLSFFFTS